MKHILIVDDDSQVRELLQRILEREGYQVTTAADGDEAIERFDPNEMDLVITDLVMPNREGLETIMTLRRQYGEIQVIAISGGGRNSGQDYLTLAKKLGAAYTFTKPFDRSDLLAAVAELVGQPVTA